MLRIRLLRNREKRPQSSTCFRGFEAVAGQFVVCNRILTPTPLRQKMLDILGLLPPVKSRGKIEKICSMKAARTTYTSVFRKFPANL